MDFRLNGELAQFLADRGLTHEDLISFPGLVKDLCHEEPPVVNYLLGKLGLAIEKHRVSTIHLINHTDCGAYGGHQAFSSSFQEREAHTGDLKNAAQIIREAYPQIAVQATLARIQNNKVIGFDLCGC